MRKTLLTKLVLLVAVVLMGAGTAWADTVTFTPGTDTGETSVTKSGITVTMTTMNNASYYQIYANQSGTFSCSNGNITKIEFTCTASGTSKYGPGNASANVGSYSYSDYTGTWEGSASSVTVSSTAQVRMSSLTITYTPSGGDTPTTYTVTYDANGGTGTLTDSNSPYNSGATVTVLANTFTRDNYTFSNWNTLADGTGTDYDEHDTFTINGNTILYAQWTANSSGTDGTATLTQSNLDLTGSYTTNTEKNIDGITYVFTDLMKNNDNIQAKASSGTIKNTTAFPGDITSVAITHSGTARAATINGSADGENWTEVITGSGSITADFSGKGYKYFQITRGSNAAYWEKIVITYSTSGSSLNPSDLAISNASTDLSFDLYNNGAAQVINYTTSSTGAITITPESPTSYFSYVHDATAKTITVTPLATTPSAQTITISQAADDDYYGGTAKFTVSVVNSDPSTPGTENNPYTVADVINGQNNLGNNIYVKGFIVGYYDNGSLKNTGATNLALADTPDETDVSKVVPVQLSKNTTPRTDFNTNDHPWNVRVAQVLVKANNNEAYFNVPGLRETSEITKVAEQVSISKAGMATYYTDCALDYTDFTDMYAYTASVSGDAITFTRVKKVPANTAVLLRNPAGAAVSNLVPVATSADAVSSNALEGTLTATSVTTGYVLNSGSNGVGFYKADATNGTEVGAHKAYLNVPSSARTFFGFSDSETTGISDAKVSQSTMQIYDLQGRSVAQPTKGLYIVNGKKVIIK